MRYSRTLYAIAILISLLRRVNSTHNLVQISLNVKLETKWSVFSDSVPYETVYEKRDDSAHNVPLSKRDYRYSGLRCQIAGKCI